MKTAAALMIGLCLAFGTYCRAEDDLAKARKELQGAVDAVGRQHPETDDFASFIGKRVSGSNGWDELVKLAEKWSELQADGGDSLLYFRYIHDPAPDAYDDEERLILRMGLAAMKPIAEAAAKLLEFDCLVPATLASFSDEGAMKVMIPVLDLFGAIRSRAIASAALCLPRDEVEAATLLGVQLAWKLDSSFHLAGVMFTASLRSMTMMTALEVTRSMERPLDVLVKLHGMTASQLFDSRARWLGELTYAISVCRRHLSMSEEELRGEIRNQLEFSGTTADLLREGNRQIQLMAAMVKEFPESKRLSSPDVADALVKALDAARKSNYPRNDEVIGNMQGILFKVISADLNEDGDRLQLALRLHEARNREWPDEDGAKSIVAAFPGLKITRDGDELVVDAINDHAVRKLARNGLIALPRRLEPWFKPQD